MAYDTKHPDTWTLEEFMSCVADAGIKSGTSNYNKIKKAMVDNSLSAADVTGTAKSMAGLLDIHWKIAQKLKTKMDAIRINFGVNPTSNPSSSSTTTTTSSYTNTSFTVFLDGQEGKRVELRTKFTKIDTITKVIQVYKDQEGLNFQSNFDKIVLISAGTTLDHDKTLGSYNIVDDHNLITVLFKARGGADWRARSLAEWNAEDLQFYIQQLSMNPMAIQKLCGVVSENSLEGSDLIEEEQNAISSVEDIVGLFEVSNDIAQQFRDAMTKWKPEIDTVSQSTDSPPAYDEIKNDSQQFETNTMSLPWAYAIGDKLDCKDSKKKWCVAEVIDMNQSYIRVQYTNWQKANGEFYYDTFDADGVARKCTDYGLVTYRENKNYQNVYKSTRKIRPLRKDAKKLRDQQKKNFKKNGNGVSKNRNQPQNTQNNGWFSSWGSGSYNSNISGLIGLQNLGNQCYMNTAIQILCQTPPLLHLFRTTQRTKQKPLLQELQILCRKAKVESSAYSPRGIKNILASSDYQSFGDYSQQDSAHALTKLLEILDNELVGHKQHHSTTLRKIFNDGLTPKTEAIVVNKIMNEYNPNTKSLVRDATTYIIREQYSCLAANCDYIQFRYRIQKQLKLPLYNHALNVPVTMFNTSGKEIKYTFPCIGYCGILTLERQITAYLRARSEYKKYYEIIGLYYMSSISNRNQIIDPKNVLEPIPKGFKCSDLVGKSIIVAIKSVKIEEEKQQEEQKEDTVLMRQFYIGLNSRGEADDFKMRIVRASIGRNLYDVKLDPELLKDEYLIYYKQRIVYPEDKINVLRLNDSMIIISCPKSCRTQFVDDNYKLIPNHWTFYVEQLKFNQFRCNSNGIDYQKVVAEFKSMKETADKRETSTDKDYSDEVTSFQIALDCYTKMAENQQTASLLLQQGFRLNTFAKCGKLSTPLTTINECLSTYFAEKIVDQGASVKCSKCKEKCTVWKENRTIVRYPQIATVLFDRFYGNGSKHDHQVQYQQDIKFCDNQRGQYDLYGVCNHSSSTTEFGHYYAYVKSVDNNDSVWYEANDRSIYSMGNKKVINNQNALLLMFEKKK